MVRNIGHDRGDVYQTLSLDNANSVVVKKHNFHNDPSDGGGLEAV